ncbi:hypothetical protein B0J13DRAFT_531179 [Dactylonectria estremocensis]|uniref:Uncharacterized protein n=1 Tax=Dactylonectria estremocensis TaxID=1079267 RepID=A0A9P9DTT0_9HYPO|nr:hypothetical protein B0J13DRAFT_531179 [Dactylonectria estremocensis]
MKYRPHTLDDKEATSVQDKVLVGQDGRGQVNEVFQGSFVINFVSMLFCCQHKLLVCFGARVDRNGNQRAVSELNSGVLRCQGGHWHPKVHQSPSEDRYSIKYNHIVNHIQVLNSIADLGGDANAFVAMQVFGAKLNVVSMQVAAAYDRGVQLHDEVGFPSKTVGAGISIIETFNSPLKERTASYIVSNAQLRDGTHGSHDKARNPGQSVI